MKSQLVSVERKFILFLLRHLIIACKMARIAECHRSELYSVKYILSVFFLLLSDGALSPVSSLNGGGPISFSILFLTNT